MDGARGGGGGGGGEEGARGGRRGGQGAGGLVEGRMELAGGVRGQRGADRAGSKSGGQAKRGYAHSRQGKRKALQPLVFLGPRPLSPGAGTSA